MTTVHKFDVSLKYGEGMEKMLDDYFGKWFTILKAEGDLYGNLQYLGIDRIFTKKTNGERFSVEYKADRRAHETGNVYIETVSVRKVGKHVKPGWAYTSTAQRLVYFISGPQTVYILDMVDIRDMLPKWEDRCKKVEVDNGDYVGEGLLVPIAEFKTMCRGRMTIDG